MSWYKKALDDFSTHEGREMSIRKFWDNRTGRREPVAAYDLLFSNGVSPIDALRAVSEYSPNFGLPEYAFSKARKREPIPSQVIQVGNQQYGSSIPDGYVRMGNFYIFADKG